MFERAEAGYEAALMQHFAVLRPLVAVHGGEIFHPDTGDGLLAVFAHSEPALACAREMQRALSVEKWPMEIGALRVRIGLHRGAAERDGQDFRGLAMHHATRVLEAGHGGQILASAAACEDLLEQARGPLRDLGLYRLPGVLAPVRLYDATEDTNANFPPPRRAQPLFAHQLPSPPTRFFGREDEMARLCSMLAPDSKETHRSGRLVTLLGPGGIGKTRLSLAVAERLLPAYSHAVWHVALAEVREAGVLPDVLRAGLGIAPETTQPALESVAAMLRAQPSLLVLDNFEQLVPEGADAVRALLERAPSLVVFVTSRVRLALTVEHEFLLAPLPLPSASARPAEMLASPSVQLFLDRAGSACRGIAGDDAAALEVAPLCRALEGMPLAIELAAARASILTPRQMLARLQHQLDFLVGGKRDMPSRHQTLRETVRWSYELLPPHLQWTFTRLSIFRGGWTLAAMEAVGASERGDILGDIAELADCSLLIAEEDVGEMRYRMLEAIREYAQERLHESGEEAELAARHHRFFCALARHLAQEAGEAERFRQIGAEGDNLRAVLAGEGPIDERAQLAIDLRDYWMVRGWFVEGRRWCQRLLAQNPSATFRASVANAAGILAWKAGELAEARDDMEQAMHIWVDAGCEEKVAGMLNNLGIVASDQGDLEAAREFYERSLAIYRRLGSRSPLAAVLSNLGEIAVVTKCLGEARAALEESLALQEALGEQLASANTLHNLAELHRELGDGATARRHLARSMRIRLALASRENLPATWTTLARIALVEGDHRRAAALFAAAETAFRELEMHPPPADRAQCERDLAAVRGALGGQEFSHASAAGRHWTLEETLTPDGDWMNPLDQPAAATSNSAA